MNAGAVAIAPTDGYRPRGGGALGDLLRALDWAATPLGEPDTWTPALRTTIDIVLNSPIAMVLMWGPRHVMIYNEGYVEIAGARHPAALGGTVPDTWPEIWDWNRPILEAGLRGETQRHLEQPLTLLRSGVPEEVYFDLFYTPVHDTDGTVGGVLCTVVDVTQRVRAERRREDDRAWLDRQNRRLREQTALLHELFEQAPSFMAVLRGPQHVFELANPPYRRLVAGRDVIGKPVAEALPEVREQGIVALLDRVYASGEPYVGRQLKVDLRGDDGDLEPRYLDFVYQPLRAADGTVTGVFVEGVDVTDHILTEERLRMAQQAGGIGSFEWFPATGRLVVSPEYRRVWGLAADVEVTEELLVSLVDPRDRARVGPQRLAADANPLAYTEYRIRRPDTGEVRWLARQGEVIEGVGPERRRYVGVAFDITGRKAIEQQLRTSQDRLAAIFGQASVGLSELSLDGRYTRVNGALCRMLGRPEEALLGLHMEDLIHPDDLEGNRTQVARLKETGIPFTFEKRYARPDGEWVWISSSMSRLDDEAGQPVALIAVKTDITERRRIELALRDLNDTLEQRVSREIAERDKAEEALRQAQKMEAVGQLTGGVAHDFNNVLQIISGNLHLLAQHVGGDAAARRRLDMAVAAVDRGAKLSSQLLAFARRQPLQPAVLDLGRLVANMDELLRRALGEAVELQVVVGSGLWNTQVDPGQMENVILNLAINARDAMEGAGRLTIELGNAVLDEHYVAKLVDVPAGQYVMLSVTDTGCGMPPDVLQRAFEPFFTTKPEGEGTGLGLSMAYGFVKQSRGHIRIYSEPGQGTSVKIYLPRTMLAESGDDGPSAPSMSGPVTGGSETILVVEDDAGVRAVVLDMLGALGYRVLSAENGEQALRIIESGEPVDLLFTDVVMPGPLRSPELARIAQQILPNLAVLFTSGYPQDAIVHGGRLDAGLELLSKPYRREDLARKLRHVLNNRRQQVMARARHHDTPAALLEPQPHHPQHVSLRVLVVEDNADSLQMVCELVGMLGHTVSGVSDGEQAWELMRNQEFDVLFTDVSLPGMSGIELARLVAASAGSRPVRIIFSTGYGKEALEHLDFPAACLRKPYDLADLQAALDEVAGADRH
jgi:PAS domain S-box-containing protein